MRPRRSPFGADPSTKFHCGNPIDHGSEASSPDIACIIKAVSATVRVIGRHIGLVAERVLHLAVGNDAVALLQPDDAVAGCRDPRRAAAIGRDGKRRDAAGNRNRRSPLEPPLERALLQALRVRPNSGESVRHLVPNSGVVVLPTRMAPCCPHSRHGDRIMVRNVVLVGHRSEGRSHPLVLTISFTVNGMP